MNNITYNKCYKYIKKIMKDDEVLSIEEINEMLDEVYTISDVEYDKEVSDIIEVSKMGSLVLGFIALVFHNDYSKKENLVYDSILATITNNSLAIIKLVVSGFDYQAGVLLRSTFELVFTLLNVMIDKKKFNLYFNSFKMNNGNKIWSENFKISNLNTTLIEYENRIFSKNSVDYKDELEYLKKWRKKNYSYYSEFVHNSFARCHLNSFTYSNDPAEDIEYNLWGGNATRIYMHLSDLNDLIFYGCICFYSIIKYTNNINLQELLKDDNRNNWTKAMILFEFYKEMHFKIK